MDLNNRTDRPKINRDHYYSPADTHIRARGCGVELANYLIGESMVRGRMNYSFINTFNYSLFYLKRTVALFPGSAVRTYQLFSSDRGLH